MDTGTGFYTSKKGDSEFTCRDTQLDNELKEILEWYKVQNIDLIFVYLGGTTIQSPVVPPMMVSMDVTQGLQLVW